MLVVGTKTNDPGQLIKIDLNGLCHHTLIVGQSGGGKSFLVARLVEEILLRSRARVLIIDPNGDFRQMSKPSKKVWTQFGETFEKIDKLTKSAGEDSFDRSELFSVGWKKRRFSYLLPQRGKAAQSEGDIAESLIVHWDTLEEDQRTFLLNANARIGPKIYMGLKAVSENARWVSVNRPDVGIGYNLRGMRDVCEQFAQSNLSLREYDYAKLLSAEDWSAVRATLEDLLSRYSLWWSAYPSKSSRPFGIADFIDGAFQNRTSSRTYWDSLVLSLDSAAQSDTLLAADVALSRCWLQAKQAWRDAAEKHGEDGFSDKRVPTFIVVDEAHNFAPERTDDPLRQRVTQRLLQIASEGRKYGLYLILATQRPTKLHRELVPECENACVLRLQSPVETDFASNLLGLAPTEKAQVHGFTLGQGMFFGRWVEGMQQLNTKVAPARIEVGGGGLPSEWRQLPDATPVAKSDGDEREEFLRETLENSAEPIDLAALAGKFLEFRPARLCLSFGLPCRTSRGRRGFSQPSSQ
jgi:Helicase HerA, central domain/ATPase family associated with various cellular activities (AAA)